MVLGSKRAYFSFIYSCSIASKVAAKIDALYHGQLFYGQDAEVRTFISRIGVASFDVYQELWQHGKNVCRAPLLWCILITKLKSRKKYRMILRQS